MKSEKIGSLKFDMPARLEVSEEKRKNQFHNAVHTIALMCVAVFIVLSATTTFYPSITVPDYYISIVSTIIGFYFGNRISFK